jgi:predicted transposase YbfD/YdcC
MVRRREILKYDTVGDEEVFLITNGSYDRFDAAALLALKRSYWDIENKLHYRKDFVFGEDRSTIRAGHGPQNMATLRNFALGLLLVNGIENVKRCVDNLQHHPAALLRRAA